MRVVQVEVKSLLKDSFKLCSGRFGFSVCLANSDRYKFCRLELIKYIVILKRILGVEDY